MSKGFVTLMAVTFTLVCAGAGTWPQRESFYAQALCDVSIDDARLLAERSGGSDWNCGTPTEVLTVCNFDAAGTRVLLEFESGRLRRVEEGERFGISGMAMRPRLHVCSGERSRQIGIVPRDETWIGATIGIDDRTIGTVTAAHWQGVYAPLGRHVLTVEKAGRAPLKLEIMVPDGTMREPLQVELP